MNEKIEKPQKKVKGDIFHTSRDGKKIKNTVQEVIEIEGYTVLAIIEEEVKEKEEK